ARLERGGQVAQVGAGVPVLLGRVRAATGRLVVVALLAAVERRLGGDAVDRAQAGDAGLHTDRAVAHLLVLADRVEQRGQVRTGGVPVGHQAVAGRAAQQPVDRHV